MKKAAKISMLVLVAVPILGLAALALLDRLYPFPVERMADRLATSSVMVRAADKSLLSWRVDGEENRRLHVEYDEVSPWLVEATIATEDKRFREHWGVDPVAVGRAFLQNLAAGRRVSGASTITMQTIRLLWPRPRRLDSKIIEAFRAWQLERLASKERILEIYFNLAPYGGNIVGAEAAARRYFAKSARQLNLSEASLLAGLPQSPARLNPLAHPEAAVKRRDFVIHRLLDEGAIEREQAVRAWREDVRLAPAPRRIEAGHFVDMALSGGPRGSAVIDATLNADMQERVRRLAEPHAEDLARKGVSGPAVVALSAADSSILAYVGNAAPAGSPGRLVDAARARRQPGSLMKPFIFALLAESGGITASTRVYDLPASWGDYSPRNMDRQWRGGMTAGDALRQSRNVTAVRQLQNAGIGRFSEFMHRLGLEAGDGRQGLSLALGAKEQRLLELVNAYAALGRLGEWLPVRHLSAQAETKPERVLSPEAAWLTLSALSVPEEREAPRLVWKTGTSWNQLDAWAIAMTPEVVVGVWCGRLGRGGADWVAGGEDALPLALAVVDAVASGKERWPAPNGVEFAEVCRDSGALPGWTCPETVASAMLSGGGNGFCRMHGGAAGRDVAETKAEADEGRAKVRIVSPRPESTYVDMDSGQSVLPLLAEAPLGKNLTWFLNGEKLGTSAAGTAFNWVMRSGSHRLSVTDGEGGVASTRLSVTAP